ncbi:MAG TPA: hypothetical protein VFA81_08395 [Burkholderiales bacterium]|nr:hypothetical protein [Burkholderiales bacterium]
MAIGNNRASLQTVSENHPASSSAEGKSPPLRDSLLSLSLLAALVFGASASISAQEHKNGTPGTSADTASQTDWDKKYKENEKKLITDFCAAPGNANAPICATIKGPCTGFTIEQCVKEGFPKPLKPDGSGSTDQSGFTWLSNVWGWLVALFTAIFGLFKNFEVGRAKAALAKVTEALGSFKGFLSDVLDQQDEVSAETRLKVAGEYNLVLLGVGGAGKTSIVRALAAMSRANPAVATDGLKLYALASDVAVFDKPVTDTGSASEGSSPKKAKKKIRMKLNIVDTVGQRLEKILELKLTRDGQPTIAVIVVDLFAPTGETQADVYSKQVDRERIEKQLRTFSEEGLRLMLTHLVKNLVGIVVFVNKVDLLSMPVRDAMRTARGEGLKFAKAASRIQNIDTVPVVVGSASLGWGVSGFRDNEYQDFHYSTLIEKVISIVKEAELS